MTDDPVLSLTLNAAATRTQLAAALMRAAFDIRAGHGQATITTLNAGTTTCGTWILTPLGEDTPAGPPTPPRNIPSTP